MNYENTAAFTGHRPSKLPWRYDEADPRCIALKEVLTEQIRLLADRGVTTFLSGMALGTDLWCAQIVLDLRKENPALQLHCILPCEGQKNKWPASEVLASSSSVPSAVRFIFLHKPQRMKGKKSGILLTAILHLSIHPGNTVLCILKHSPVFRTMKDLAPDTFYRSTHQRSFGIEIVINGSHRHPACRRNGTDIDRRPSLPPDQFPAGL